MSLKERVYSILIVSATDAFTSAFADLLPHWFSLNILLKIFMRWYPSHKTNSIHGSLP